MSKPRTVHTPGGNPPGPPETENAATAPAVIAGPEAAPVETTDDESYREAARGLRAKDVDPTRLRRAVLTLDGWVCPATSPAPAVKQ